MDSVVGLLTLAGMIWLTRWFWRRSSPDEALWSFWDFVRREMDE